MLLTLGRATTEVDLALLGSDLAVNAAQRGAELQRTWGRGARIFVEGVRSTASLVISDACLAKCLTW